MSSKSSSFHSEGNSSTRDANISAYSDTESYSDYGGMCMHFCASNANGLC